MRPLFAGVAAGLMLAACAPAAPPPPVNDPAAVKAGIDKMNAAQSAAIKAGDNAGGIANYAPDAIVMMPNMPTWSGHDAIEKGFAGLMAAGKMTQFDQATDDVIVAGDMAIETGHIALTITPSKGKPMSDKIKYMTIWKKQPTGAWQIVRDISNSDLPPAK